ncbi:hypothetical protein ABFS83_08G003100 [Erythranthe nasuta]
MMASSSSSSSIKVSYERLKKQDMEVDEEYKGLMEKAMGRLRKSRLRRLHVNNNNSRRHKNTRSGGNSSSRRLKIPSLKRFLRRKARLVKLGLNKVYKRLKESQSHFGDLFAGNYLFMQVTPTPLKYAPSDHHLHAKSFANSATAAAHNYHLHPHPHHHHHAPLSSIPTNNNHNHNIPT